ncbi:GNAT family N-acetyltransferase [Roseateles sp. PN1]|uniref:GNAT family N-acetyltransferase n=1 Tax=Roseateles sp. PN1 TaxID=3137372 RepID=UPI00313A0AE3
MTAARTVLTELRSARLLLRAPAPQLTEAVCAFQLRNLAHFAPWDPSYPPSYFEAETVALALSQSAQAWADDQGYNYWLSPLSEPEKIIGKVQLSQVSRGPFQNAALGYKLDAAAQGQGLMREALQCVIAQAFAPGGIHLHRLQAAVRPENLRSLGLLQRLGFEDAGLQRRYLFINEAWRDHQVFALINPAWPDQQAPN